MRVSMTKTSKQIFTVAEMPIVNQIIKDCKEDEMPIEDYCLMAMNAFDKNCRWEIFRPCAEMAKNARVWDRYCENSGTADIWISFLAFNKFEGAYECGVYLSDLWDLTDENHSEITGYMYVNAFTNNDR